jgi:hypothetical protein
MAYYQTNPNQPPVYNPQLGAQVYYVQPTSPSQPLIVHNQVAYPTAAPEYSIVVHEHHHRVHRMASSSFILAICGLFFFPGKISKFINNLKLLIILLAILILFQRGLNMLGIFCVILIILRSFNLFDQISVEVLPLAFRLIIIFQY